MHDGQAVWLTLAGKERPAVVIEVRPLLVRVAYGTHEEHVGWDGPRVPRGTRAAKRWPLVDDVTYFYGANWAWEVPSLLRPGSGDCIDALLDEIRRIVAEHDVRRMNE